eukprot:7608131-Pyramimonas_sp.AAC.1
MLIITGLLYAAPAKYHVSSWDIHRLTSNGRPRFGISLSARGCRLWGHCSFTVTTSTPTPPLTPSPPATWRPGLTPGSRDLLGGQELAGDSETSTTAALHDADLPALFESVAPPPEETGLPIAARRQALEDRIEAWARSWIPTLM